MSEKTEQVEKWDDKVLEGSSSLKKGVLLACIVGVIFLPVSYFMLSEKNTSDARLLYIKQDYNGSLSILERVLASSDDYSEHDAALRIKAAIYLDKGGDHYNINSAYSVLTQLFNSTRSEADALRVLSVGRVLNKATKELLPYYEVIADKGDLIASQIVADHYLQSEHPRTQQKAKIYLDKLPESFDKQLKLSDLVLLNGISASTIEVASKHLSSAAMLGSGEAVVRLAFLEIEKAKLKKVSNASVNEFSNLIRKSLNMGYDGELLKKAENIIRFGRDGVQRDAVLANQIKEIISKNDNE